MTTDEDAGRSGKTTNKLSDPDDPDFANAAFGLHEAGTPTPEIAAKLGGSEKFIEAALRKLCRLPHDGHFFRRVARIDLVTDGYDLPIGRIIEVRE